MNIFYLNRDPIKCALQHCDKHVVKMIIEYAQLMSTAHRVLDGELFFDKAMLSAKRELASNFSSHVEAMFKDFTSELGNVDRSTAGDINRTTKLLVSRVNLVGVQRTGFEVVHEKAGYRAFVKLKYSANLSNRLILEQIKRNSKLKAKLESTEKFKELEDSVNSIEQGDTV